MISSVLTLAGHLKTDIRTEQVLTVHRIVSETCLTHPLFYNFGGQVIPPALHAELVPTLQTCEILRKKNPMHHTYESCSERKELIQSGKPALAMSRGKAKISYYKH